MLLNSIRYAINEICKFIVVFSKKLFTEDNFLSLSALPSTVARIWMDWFRFVSFEMNSFQNGQFTIWWQLINWLQHSLGYLFARCFFTLWRPEKKRTVYSKQKFVCFRLCWLVGSFRSVLSYRTVSNAMTNWRCWNRVNFFLFRFVFVCVCVVFLKLNAILKRRSTLNTHVVCNRTEMKTLPNVTNGVHFFLASSSSFSWPFKKYYRCTYTRIGS